LTASLGLSAYVVLDRHFGLGIGLAGGLSLTGLAVFGWFGLELLMGSRTKGRLMDGSRTPLATKIDQLLTEARVIIPGAQALFGFQFIAMLTTGFDRLPQSAKFVHAAALLLIAINIILLMTPAALHRLSFAGEDSDLFFRIGSALVIASAAFLAGGIALESYVVVLKTFESGGWAEVSAGFIFVTLMLLWYVLPLALRHWRNQNMRTIERKVA
jgi:thiosulfate reductase cytochrome b subunit